MKQLLLIISLIATSLLFAPVASAASDPLSVPNNKIGIHILFPSELNEAANLVNTSNGDWGYVLIPIQSGDKDLKKWQQFMDSAAQKHLIPIVRLATEGDYFNTKVWRRPTEADILDFANFLNSLSWPTHNRYVVVFNEVNRGDEWGGAVNPTEYAQLLSYATTVFTYLNPDFFVISSGLDNAAPDQGTTYMNEYTFLRAMNQASPGIFDHVDGIASHAYPNPGFAQPPSSRGTQGVGSFVYEREQIKQFTNKKLPIFITETGWSSDKVSPTTQAAYYQTALSSIWNDPDIVAITPFILRASGPFAQFSLQDPNGNPTAQYTALKNIAKTKGEPQVIKQVLAAAITSNNVPERIFPVNEMEKTNMTLSQQLQATFKWMLKL